MPVGGLDTMPAAAPLDTAQLGADLKRIEAKLDRLIAFIEELSTFSEQLASGPFAALLGGSLKR